MEGLIASFMTGISTSNAPDAGTLKAGNIYAQGFDERVSISSPVTIIIPLPGTLLWAIAFGEPSNGESYLARCRFLTQSSPTAVFSYSQTVGLYPNGYSYGASSELKYTGDTIQVKLTATSTGGGINARQVKCGIIFAIDP